MPTHEDPFHTNVVLSPSESAQPATSCNVTVSDDGISFPGHEAQLNVDEPLPPLLPAELPPDPLLEPEVIVPEELRDDEDPLDEEEPDDEEDDSDEEDEELLDEDDELLDELELELD